MALTENEKTALRLIVEKLEDLENAVIGAINNADYSGFEQQDAHARLARRIECGEILRLLD